VTITQLEIRFKTKVSHKHMVVIYHRNTPLPKVRKGLDRYRRSMSARVPLVNPARPWSRSGTPGRTTSASPLAGRCELHPKRYGRVGACITSFTPQRGERRGVYYNQTVGVTEWHEGKNFFVNGYWGDFSFSNCT
jgi:hypothetical protein